MRTVASITFVLLGLAYPVLVYSGLRLFEPRLVAVFLGSILLLRLLLSPGRARVVTLGRSLSFPLALLGLAYLLTFLFNEGRFFLFVPAMFSTALMMSFGRSLIRPPSVVESIARMKEPEMSEEKVVYCRRVTLLWVLFFLVNASVSVVLALSAELETWTLYNGLIAYLLMGLLFLGEFLYRLYRFPHLRQGVARRWFPARERRP